MGLHTGEPRVGQERYVGIGVHRAARIGAAGHGGQALLSSTTKELAEEDLPAGVTIRDLGERRLKDLQQPQRLYQLEIEGLQVKFAELNTLDVELRRRRRRMYAGSALIGVLAAAVVVPVFAFAQGDSNSGVVVRGNAVALVDPSSNRVSDAVSVGARPGDLAVGSGAVWVANRDDQSVSRIDPATDTVTRTLSVAQTPTGLAASSGAVWVVGSDPSGPLVTVRRIDPRFDTVTETGRIGNVVPGGAGTVAASGATVWVAPSTGLLTRLNATSGRPVQTVDPNAGPAAVAVGDGAVWVADSDANTVTRVDPTGLLTAISVGHGPSGIAVGAGGVWVVDTLDNAVVRIDPSTRAVTTTVPVGRSPAGVTVGAGSVWVANSGDGTVSRIDPAAGKVTQTIDVGGSPQQLVSSQGRIWVTVDEQAIANAPAAGSGGTLRVSSQHDVDFMDPALAFVPISWQLLDATCAKLVNYPDRPAPAGSRLVPEVAQALPTRSADGKTYTFTIRRGFRFSPPSNQPVTAQTFRYSIERSLSATMKSPAQPFMDNIVGATAYMAGKAAHISGIAAQGNRLTIRLLAPEPDLITRLGLPFFCAVPIGTPLDPNGVRTIPSAGPYYVSSYTPGQGIVLKRNPNYTGSRPHHFARIQVTVGVSHHNADAQVEAGRSDYPLDGIDPADAASINAHYGPNSPAARKGRQQYFATAQLGLDYIVLNTHRPLFRNARLREAVNYAINRRALARVGPIFGGPPDRPTDHYLPPGMPGATNTPTYPLTPNLAAAKRLAGNQQRTAILYTCNNPTCRQLTQIIKTNLAAIGITVIAKTFPLPALTQRAGTPGEPFDLSLTEGWAADYPDPYDFLNYVLETGGQVAPPFHDPNYTPKLAAAAQLTGPTRYLTYGKLATQIARNAAPWIAYGNFTSQDFFSSRIGCQTYQPVYGTDLTNLCTRH
jgi:peptide/nickel transport system substrate-binding protein